MRAQAAFDGAYGAAGSKNGGDRGALPREWGAMTAVVERRSRMDYCMKRAREALMTAWLYSGLDAEAGSLRAHLGACTRMPSPVGIRLCCHWRPRLLTSLTVPLDDRPGTAYLDRIPTTLLAFGGNM